MENTEIIDYVMQYPSLGKPLKHTAYRHTDIQTDRQTRRQTDMGFTYSSVLWEEGVFPAENQ